MLNLSKGSTLKLKIIEKKLPIYGEFFVLGAILCVFLRHLNELYEFDDIITICKRNK